MRMRAGAACRRATLQISHTDLSPRTPAAAHRNKNLGDGIDYGQQHRDSAGALGDLIHETLQLLEQRGGPDAYINLKYIISVYESCMAV